jgi:dipeptidyl aminopeptidase/acylaminoacyl peptidase
MFAKAFQKCLALAISLSASYAFSETLTPHAFSVQDMVAMERLSEPTVSPDGKWVVYVRKSWDAKANKSTANLWLVSTDGTVSRSLTSAQYKSDNSPVWSPDGRTLAFVSNRSESQQIWVTLLDGGEARQLSDLPVDVSNLKWSPDGSYLAFSAEVYPDAKDLAQTKKRDKDREDSQIKAMIFDQLMERHWDEWFVGKRNHIFVVPVKNTISGWSATGEALDLMRGVDGDAPTKPSGGAEEFAWSADSTEIAYTMQIGKDLAWTTDLNIYLVPVKGGPAKCITADNKATDKIPSYSPDGKSIAYLAMSKPGFESDRLKIKLYDRKSGTIRTLTEGWDRSVGSLSWTHDSKSLIVTAEENARQKIFHVDAATGKVRELVGEHFNDNVSLGPKDEVVFLQDSFMNPAEVWIAKPDGNKNQLTHVNAERVGQTLRSTAESFEFVGSLGEKVQGWIMKPVAFKEGRKYPLAFIIHGGPQGAVEDHFSYRWNPQAYAGAGYGVVMINFHGSTGFGQKFTDSVSGDWGGKPYEDLMKGLDYVLATNKWIDAGRVGALGASYGGFMINWINGHTDRFKCLVNHDGVFDSIGMYFGTDELWFEEWENGGVPWERPEEFEKFSPSRFVGKWKTPTLVIQGGKDYRIPETQGLSTFTALQRRGIPSKLLYFPDENHWVMKPKNSILWHQTVIGWLDQWLK